MSSIEKDERLLPLPNAADLNLAPSQDIPSNYAPFYDDDSFSEGRSLREYFLIVYKKLPIILAMTILITAAVAFYMYRQASIYEAQTTLVLEPRKPKAQSKEVYINFGEDINYSNTQLRLLRDPDLMRDVVIRLGLYSNPNLLGNSDKGFLASLRSMVTGDKSTDDKTASLPTLNGNQNTTDAAVLTPEESRRVNMYTGMLAGGLSVEQIPTTNLVNIKIQSTNAELAPQVANAVAQVFIEKDVKRAIQGSENTYEDLSKSIEKLKTNIAQQEQERIDYMRGSNLPLTDNKSNDFNAARLQTLSTQFLTAEDDRRKIQAEYEAAVSASSRGDILGVIGDKSYINSAREKALERTRDLEKSIEAIDQKIQEAENKRAQLLVRYTEEYPEVKAINAQIKGLNETKEKVKTEVSAKIESDNTKLKTTAEKETLSGLQAQLGAAQRREGELKSAYFNAIGIANQQGQSATRLTTLTNEIESNRNLLSTYTLRQKEMELIISSSSPDNITISSKSQTADLVGPQRNRNILIAFLLSMGMGIGLAFLLDYLDDSIKTSDDVGKYLGLPTLALIPHESVLGKRKRSNLLAENAEIASSTALIAIEDSRSPIAEAYRHLRTSLLFSSAGKPPQTVLVTSSQPSEGKTTTAINTAITLAQSGAEVVIIDCDLRRPRLHNHFGMDNSSGLTNYLSGEKNPENLLKPYPALPKVKVITSGPIPPNPAELLSSNEMKNLLTYLKGNFNHVIIDSPPAISFTDAAVLSTLVDGVILVAMAGKSSIQLIRRFKQRLGSVGTRIYGVVLNGIKPDSFEYGYYGYGYEYSYYDDNDDSTPKMEDSVKTNAAKN